MAQHTGHPTDATHSTREVRELRLLFEISQILDSSMDLREVLGPVLQAMAKHLGMLRGTITLVSADGTEVVIDEAYGLSPSQLRRGRYKLGEGITGTVAQTGKPWVVPRISEAPEFLDRTGARKSDPQEEVGFVCVPIVHGQQIIGALSADRLWGQEPASDTPVEPSTAAQEADLRLLQTIASMIAQAASLRQKAYQQQQRLLEENARLQAELETRFHPSNIIGTSKAMRSVYEMLARVCKSDATVLIRGESGVGKELVAQAIHYNSHRSAQPFIKVNCAALPPTVLESELFGHEQGAFTGAIRQRKGRFELAQGGTIFLDEIGDFPLTTQIMLLRVLQEKEFERVGGTHTLKADVRIIAATNRELEALMGAEKFREDLYYRLNVFPVHVPPLRERRTDIPLLADFFVEKYAKANGKTVRRISTPAIDMLTSYHWPGNVRELENCLERAVLLSDDEVIHGHHLPPTLQTAEATDTRHGALQATLDNVERELIAEALKEARGNMAKAARALGITERTMGLRVRKYGLDPTRFRARNR